MTLSDADIQATKVPFGKNQFKISDGGGLYLLVKSSGRYWKLAYRFDGKQKTLAFGVYPSVSLEQAREKREEAKKLLAEKIDPGLLRKQERQEQRAGTETSNPGLDRQPLTNVSHLSYKAEHAAGLQQQPLVLNKVDQDMVEQRRLCILQILVNVEAYRTSENVLLSKLDALGYKISFDRLRTDLAWLYEQQVLHIETAQLWNIFLTQAGLDAAYGRMWIPGIQRPVS